MTQENFFNNRIVNDCNLLLIDVVDAKTINSFKARVDKLFEKKKKHLQKSKKKSINSSRNWTKLMRN